MYTTKKLKYIRFKIIDAGHHSLAYLFRNKWPFLYPNKFFGRLLSNCSSTCIKCKKKCSQQVKKSKIEI